MEGDPASAVVYMQLITRWRSDHELSATARIKWITAGF
jgi:hypothetical protein